MSILSTPITNLPSPYFLYFPGLLPKHIAFVRRRADTHCVSAQSRAWWYSDSESNPRKRSSKRSVLEEDEGGKGSWWSRSYDDYDGYYDEIDSKRYKDESDWTDVGFFKVLKSYGWMLPAILISMLLATGPKAFLMALAFPLGQSALSFAVDKLWGRADTTQKPPRSKFRKQKHGGNSSGAHSRNPKRPRDTVSEENGRESWVSNGTAVGARPAYRGWDELDIKKKGSRTSPRGERPSSGGANKTGPERKRKLVRRGENGDRPLLLRLLIAVFPFLGSWVKIL